MIERFQLDELVLDLAIASLGFELNPTEKAPVEHPAVTARLGLSGEWAGALEIRCDAIMATNIAAAMFCASADDVDDADMNDAVGEITNILAGNIAPLLSADCRLNLPVIIGDSETMRDTSVVIDSVYESEQASLSVSLIAEKPT